MCGSEKAIWKKLKQNMNKEHSLYTGTIKYLERIFTIVPHIIAGRHWKTISLFSSKDMC